MSEVKRDLPRGRTASPRTPINAEDLAACEVCGAYVAVGGRACGNIGAADLTGGKVLGTDRRPR